MHSITGAQALVRALQAEQVPYAFGVVGGKLAPLLYALSNQSQIRFFGVRHEAAGPMMAAAVNAASGQVAVALGEMGPGGLNLVSGMGVAFNNNLPVLAITSNQHRAAAYPHSGMFMDLDTQAVLAPLTKWNAVVHDPRRIPELVRRAFREALGGRPGPVHLDFPQDVLSAKVAFADDEFDLAPDRYRATLGSRPSQESVRAAVRLLGQARRPLIVAGGGVVASGAASLVRALATRLRAPVVPTQMALGVVPSTSEHFIGHGGLVAGDAIRQAFDQADAILSIGCRHSSWMWDEHGPMTRRHHRVVSINTDPSALGHPAVHEVAMLADARLALTDVLEAMDADRALATEDGWLPRMRAVRGVHDERLGAMAREAGPVMHPAALAQAVGAALPGGALVVFDGGHTSFWSNDLTPVEDVRTRFHDPGMAHLGFGVPYAMALKLLHPDKPVLNITGDGSFGFTLNELDTARRNGLAIINVIHNNEAWGIIQSGQRAQLNFELGTGLEGTDYAAIARGFGCHGERVESVQDVEPALARAMASGLPAVLDCRTRFVSHPAAPLFGSMNRYGFDGLTRTPAVPVA